MNIPVNQPLFDGKEKQYLTECIDSGWISSEGPFVARFENEFAARVGRQFGIAVSSGSGALDIAVSSLGLGPGDEVIMPSLTIISCAAAIVRAGATPVLVDSETDSWNMAAADIEAHITPRTRAIMAVHLYGLTADMAEIKAIADRHGLMLIEDAAQAIGQLCSNRPCGSFGTISAFSFYPNKHITTGEGGMLVTDDEQLAARCRSLRNICFQPDRRFVHEELGWNYRMTNMQAALGCAQLENLEAHIARKRKIGARYNEQLAGTELQLPLPHTPWTENLYWIYGIVLAGEATMKVEQVRARLAQKGIGTRPFFWPMHEQPVFRKMGLFAGIRLPVAERLARRGFYLPSGLGITDAEIDHVAAVLKGILS